MNIFASSPDPVRSAEVLDDKRVVKMILESAQLLSNVCGGPYRPTHLKHPCALWVAADPANYTWLYMHFQALLSEYRLRYQKDHACSRISLALPAAPLQAISFVNCTKDFKDLPIHQAYQQQLLKKWDEDKRVPRWARRELDPAGRIALFK